MPDTHEPGPVQAVPADQYVRLPEGTGLHVSPRYGILTGDSGGGALWIRSETARMLSQCDGTRTVADLLAARAAAFDASGDLELALAVVELAGLAANGGVILSPEAQLSPPTLTGDPLIYYPTGLQVELTTSCNLECGYCYRRTNPALEETRLATDQLLSILGDLTGKGLITVELTGGEPLLHPDFARILRFCGENVRLVGILTNGTLITPEIIELLLPLREKVVLSIALDSHRPEVHDHRRGLPGAFERTTAGIRLLGEHGFLTRVTTVVDEGNWPDLEETLLLARELGASRFSYSPVIPVGRATSPAATWSLNQWDVFQREQELRRKYADFMHLFTEDDVLQVNSPGGCGGGHRTYAMDPLGNVRPCVTFDDRTAVLGSLATESSEAVFGRELPDAMADLVPPRPEDCGECEHRFFCQNCSLRALVASQWIGEDKCVWLQTPVAARWRALVARQMAAETFAV